MMDLKLIKLEAENIKRLKAIEITPKGHMICIGGKNASGKTSCLDSIEYALGGKNTICERPLRDGTRKGIIKCDFDRFQVERTFTNKGTQLKITTKDGEEYPSPQKMLDRLMGTLSFDPLAFTKMNSKLQLETLRKMTGLNFSENETQRKKYFESRTDTNRSLKDYDSQLEAYKDLPKEPEKVNITELLNEHTIVQRKNAYFSDSQEKLADIVDDIEEQEGELKRLKTSKLAIETELKELKLIDIKELEERINSSEKTNSLYEKHQQKKTLLKKTTELRISSEELTTMIKSLDTEKTKMLTEAEMPIDGLGFDEEGVTYKNIPFEQCSGAEQLRISVAMGLALNPTLKILLIRDGSLLDDESYEMIAKMAQENNAQIWIEQVGENKRCQIIIDDGEIKGIV